MAFAKGFPADLAQNHARDMSGAKPSPEGARDLCHRRFLWEQERVFPTKLDEGFAAFLGPFLKRLYHRLWVWFSYFRIGKSLNFRSFTDQAERVEKVLIANVRAGAFGPDRNARATQLRLRVLPGTLAWALWLRGDRRFSEEAASASLKA